MTPLRGVHVLLPDGSEDVYVDSDGGHGLRADALQVEHYYALMQDGFLFVFRTERDHEDEVVGHRRISIYAPGGWHRVRSRWVPYTGPRQYEQFTQFT